MKKLISASAVAFAVLFGELLIEWIFPARPNLMAFSWIPVVIWAFTGAIISSVRGRLNVIFVLATLGFYWIGNLNAVASYFHYGSHYLTDLQTANVIYASYALVFVFAIACFEQLFPALTPVHYSTLRKESLNTIFFIGASVFPLIWIADELIALRRIPILSGESIVDDMYAIQYGKLYGYGILIGVSALLMWSKVRQASWHGRSVLFAGLLIAAFAMVFDGRRIFLLAFLGALLAYELSGFADKKLWKPVLKFSVVLLGVYVAILYARQGGRLITYPDPAQIFSKVGVEYRDFAFVVTHIEPGGLRGYSWLGSALGGFGNWLLLALFGLDKNELVFSGSAYQLALFYKSAFGIRIGLIPEIWLQYGMFGTLFCFPVAALYVWLARLVEQAKTEVGRVFAAMAFGVALLSFVGQASAITGYWSLILYLALVWLFLEQFRPNRFSPA